MWDDWATGPTQVVASVADEVVLVTGAAGGVGSMVVQLALRAEHASSRWSRPRRASRWCPGCRGRVDAGRCSRGRARRRSRCHAGRRHRRRRAPRRAHGLGPARRTRRRRRLHGRHVATLDLPNWLLGDVSVLPVNLLRRAGEGDAVVDELTAARRRRAAVASRLRDDESRASTADQARCAARPCCTPCIARWSSDRVVNDRPGVVSEDSERHGGAVRAARFGVRRHGRLRGRHRHRRLPSVVVSPPPSPRAWS